MEKINDEDAKDYCYYRYHYVDDDCDDYDDVDCYGRYCF